MPPSKSAKSEGKASHSQGPSSAKPKPGKADKVVKVVKAPAKEAVSPKPAAPKAPAPEVTPPKLSALPSAKKKEVAPKAKAKPSTATKKAEAEAAVEIVPKTPILPVKAVKKLDPSDPWVLGQRDKILQLRDSILESMHGVAKDTLRSRAEGSEASAFGMHQADAGSDAYDRDFALSLLSQEQDALYEIEEALKRIELGTYGVCEMSGKVIMRARLEALPFARYTVECQSEVERQKKLHKARMPVTSLFGLTDEEAAESEEEDQPLDSKE